MNTNQIDFKINTQSFLTRSDCVKHLENTRNGLVIIHLNICSIFKHFEELLILIHELKYYPDVIICTETKKIDINLYNIQGYTAYYNNGNINQNDGVITYIKMNWLKNI